MKRIKCKYCDKLVKIDNIQTGNEYYCPRCTNLIYRPSETKISIVIIIITAILTFLLAIYEPLVSIYIFKNNQVSILDSLIILFHKDIFSTFLLSFTIIIAPFLMMILTLLIIFHKILKINNYFLSILIKIYLFIKNYSMIEVYFLGVLITMIKLDKLSNMTLQYGLFINAFFVVLLYISLIWFNPYDILDIHKRKKIDQNSILKTSIYILLAIIFIPAANLLPMMPTSKFSVIYENTIFDGIKILFSNDDYFMGTLIFFTSICIPILKIIGLIFMIIMVKYNIFLSYNKFITKYYIFSNFLGKYSMLDVFVVVLGSAFIQYDNLMTVDLGKAIIPFSLVVFFTMMATKSFDTRLLWKRDEKQQ